VTKGNEREVETGAPPILGTQIIDCWAFLRCVPDPINAQLAQNFPAKGRPLFLESQSGPAAPTPVVPSGTTPFPVPPPLSQMASDPIPRTHTEAKPAMSSTTQHPLRANSAEHAVENTTADTTPGSFNIYSTEPLTNEGGVDQGAHTAPEKRKNKIIKSKFLLALHSKTATESSFNLVFAKPFRKFKAFFHVGGPSDSRSPLPRAMSYQSEYLRHSISTHTANSSNFLKKRLASTQAYQFESDGHPF
jgi:hypothetical protein